MNNKFVQVIKDMEQKIEVIEKKIDKSSQYELQHKSHIQPQLHTTNNTNNTTNNTNNTNNINNGVVVNINLVKYGAEDISRIDKNELVNILTYGFRSTLKLTESLHFNPKYPEYHNIYIANMKSKYAMVYNGESWDLVNKNQLIDTIYDDKRAYIEQNLDDFVNSLSKSRINALKRWLEIDDDNPKILEVKEEIKLLLYNKSDVPLKTKKSSNKTVGNMNNIDIVN